MVRHDTQILQGCLCDPDAPTWIAIQADGRMLKMSHADYTIFEQAWNLGKQPLMIASHILNGQTTLKYVPIHLAQTQSD